MSWSVTFNDLDNTSQIPPETVEWMMTQHIKYPHDMELALNLAKKAGLKSAVITGARTPNPYGGDEVVDISVRGMVIATDFQSVMKEILGYGPEETGGNDIPDQENDAG
jgi:hypothetical protein